MRLFCFYLELDVAHRVGPHHRPTDHRREHGRREVVTREAGLDVLRIGVPGRTGISREEEPETQSSPRRRPQAPGWIES